MSKVNYCDACVPMLAIASKKMLILSSDPCLTIQVCDACAERCAQCEYMIIGDEETVERLWEAEEARRDALFQLEEDEREANF